MPEQGRPMPEIKFSEGEKAFLKGEIKYLLEKKVIVHTHHVTGDFVANVFLRGKRTGQIQDDLKPETP